MTIDEVRELFRYNRWANRRIFDGVVGLSEKEYLRDLRSSHGGIHGTLAHLVWAEELWLARWLGRGGPAVAQGRDLHSLREVTARWEQVDTERQEWLAGFPDSRLQETVSVKPSTGGEFVHTFRQMFRHVVNHSSYHRGQVVTMVRQTGCPAPSTDLILFYREPADPPS